MEIKVKLREVPIRDEESGRVYAVRTMRTAQDIAAFVEESEKDEVVSKLESMVWEVYHKEGNQS